MPEPDWPRLILDLLKEDIHAIRTVGGFDDRDVVINVFGRTERLESFYREILTSGEAKSD